MAEALGEHRRVAGAAAIGALERAIEDRSDQALGPVLDAERLGYPADLPAHDGVVPERDGFILAPIGRVEIRWRGPRILGERAGGAARPDEFGGHPLGVEREVGDNRDQFVTFFLERSAAGAVI